jgi:hypothetical protein
MSFFAVRHTITSWVASAFGMSSAYGMGIANKAMLKVFQPFFVQMTLPYSVVRGEETPVTVTVFNYLSSCAPVSLLRRWLYYAYKLQTSQLTVGRRFIGN